MKLYAIVFVVLLSVAVFGQSAEAVDKAPQNFEKALKSDNPGLIESAIFLTVKYKLFYPEKDTENLVKAIDRLVIDGQTKSIRYKAYLASEYLKHGELLANVEKENYKDGDQFFKLLADKLENESLVTR